MEKKIENIAENALNGRNIRLIDVEIRGERKNKIVEIFIDSPGELDLDELTEVSRDINSLIDESDFKGEILKVVVSSPGVDRPFRFAWQVGKARKQDF
ncbi:MAG: ribosome maturation factor RimP [Ignavibacteria bacterium]